MGKARLLSLTALVAVAMGACGVSAAEELTWTGDGNSLWDTSTQNWLNDDEEPTAWSDGADATFDDEGFSEVAITEDITAGTVTVRGEEGVEYTFTFDGGSLTAGSLTIGEGVSLTITETGTLKITDTLTNAGTLTLGDTSESSGEMGPVSTPGTVTVDLASAIENSGKIIIGDGVVFVLNDSLLDESGVYTFITGEGSVSGWGNLTTSNFELDGEILTGRSQLELTAEGQVSVTFVEAADLVWNGTEESSAWNKTSENWKNNGVADLFYDYDNVTFDSTSTVLDVSIGEAIIAGSVTVASGEYTWKFERGGSLDISSLEVAYGASLTINMTGELTISGKVTNAGSLTFDATVLDLGSAIENTGKVTVGSGVTLVLNDSLVSSTDGNNTTYTFITGDGTIDGWNSLTKSNFMLDGSVISGRSTVDVGTADGQVTVEIVDAANLVWNGTSDNSAWDTEKSQNWKNGSEDDKFYSQDNVTFNDAAESTTVSIEESVMAGRMTVASGEYTFAISEEGAVMASSLTINSGSSLTISGSGSLTISYSEDEQIAVNGTLKIEEGTTTNLGGIVRIGNGNGTTGTIEITGGTTTFENSVMVGNNNNSSEATSKITISDGIVIFEEQVNVGYVSYNASENASASGTLEISGGKTTFDNYVCVGHTNTAGTTATGTLTISGDGTEVTFYSLSVGYGAWDGSTGYGTAEITGGTVTVTDVTYIGRTGSDAATSYGSLTISDGDVTLGGATYIGRSITAGSEAYGALIITGGTTKITGDVYIGYVNVEGATANGYVDISGGTVTFGEEGEESEKHTVFVGSDYADNDTSNASFTISGTATVTFYDEVDIGYARSTTTAGENDNDSFTISGGTVTFNGTVYVGRARVEEGTTASGSFTITGGETTIHTAYVGYADATNAHAEGTFTISGGKTTFETASTIAYSYTAGASTEASMTISGDETKVYFTGDLFIGRAAAAGATAEGSLKISGGATVNFAGMQLGRTTSNGDSSYGELTIGTEGADDDSTTVTFSSYLYLGYNLSGDGTSSEGKATIYSGTVEFKSAQIGYSSAGGEGSGTIIIGSKDGGAPNVTFSSTVYIGNATDTAGTAKGTIEIHSGTTTFSNAVYVGNSTASTGSAEGTLTIDGGDTTFKGAFYVGYATGDGAATGSVDISGGTVAFNGNITVAGDSSSFSVGSGADVTIAKVTVDLASAISNSGTITLDEGVTFVLNDSLATTEDNTTTYTFISDDGTIIVGTESTWTDSLGYANFVTSSGMALDTVHTTINLETAGSLTVTYSSADLIWTGKDSNVWVNNQDTLLNWKDSDNTETYFINGDNVTFDDTAGTDKRTVSIGEEIVAGTVTVDGAAYTWAFSEDGGSVTADSLTLNGDGASLTITGNGEFDLGNTSDQSLAGKGSITVSDGATLKLVEGGDDKYEDENITITVSSGGTLDVDGDGGTMFKLVLDGGTLTSSIDMTETKKQLPSITLTANSTVDATHNLGMIGGSYSETRLDLGGYTLTKTGSSSFFLENTKVTAGTIDVTEGTLTLYGTDASEASITVETGATLAVGSANSNYDSKVGVLTSSGTVDLKAGSTLEITGNSVISGSLSIETNNGNSSTLKVTGGANLTLNVSSATVGSGSSLSLEGSSSLTLNTSLAFHDSSNNASGTVAFSESASLIINQSVFEDVTVEEGEEVAVAIISANTITFGNTEIIESSDAFETFTNNNITVDTGQLILTGWSYENGTLYAIVTIPEPELFSIFFGLGAIGLVATRRRRRVA